MRIAFAFAACALAAALSGCISQTITRREFYEPTNQTLQTRKDGFKFGAIKSETIKTGSPDWSDSKSLNLISVGR